MTNLRCLAQIPCVRFLRAAGGAEDREGVARHLEVQFPSPQLVDVDVVVNVDNRNSLKNHRFPPIPVGSDTNTALPLMKP